MGHYGRKDSVSFGAVRNTTKNFVGEELKLLFNEAAGEGAA